MTPIKVQDAKREEGFTLIELLVVVIIIGILAAIAIPTFLNQRERGWQSELTSAVRNAALEVEAEATQVNGTYPADGTEVKALLDPFFARSGTDVTNMSYDYVRVGSGTGFQICAQHPQVNSGANNVTYDSALGGVQPFAEALCGTGYTVAIAG